MRQREVPERFCPECGGVFFRDHPGGVLECMHRDDCGLLVAEDGTRAADHRRVMTTGGVGSADPRPPPSGSYSPSWVTPAI